MYRNWKIVDTPSEMLYLKNSSTIFINTKNKENQKEFVLSKDKIAIEIP